MAPIMLVVAPMTPRLSARFGANKVVSIGMCGVTVGLLLFRGISPHTSYWYILLSIAFLVSGMAMSMSPMTASIMSAVPARRAGAGSAMNDATRELGAALGIALMGSLAASRYTANLVHVTRQLPASVRHRAGISLADALSTATNLGGSAGHALTVGAQHAFIGGIHLAVTCGAALSAAAAVVVFRRLPRQAAHGTSLHSAVEAMETTADWDSQESNPPSPGPATQCDTKRPSHPNVGCGMVSPWICHSWSRSSLPGPMVSATDWATSGLIVRSSWSFCATSADCSAANMPRSCVALTTKSKRPVRMSSPSGPATRSTRKRS